MDAGAFIMHRCHGISTDINRDATRAITKMKATITQRFVIQGCEVDAESDCRFCFFWIKLADSGEWRARYVRHWYEKVGLCVFVQSSSNWSSTSLPSSSNTPAVQTGARLTPLSLNYSGPVCNTLQGRARLTIAVRLSTG
jgi:hypothetical protein